METRQLFGRKQIYTDVETITAENVAEVLSLALSDHLVNQGEIQYLWDYYRGKTPILQKTKEVRESLNHKITSPLLVATRQRHHIAIRCIE